MLTKEQSDYVDGLRINYPGLEDSVITSTLKEAQWSDDEVREALDRYHRSAMPVPPPTPAPMAPETMVSSVAAQPTLSQTPVVEHLSAEPAFASPSRPIGKLIAIISGILLLLVGIGAGAYYVMNYTSLFGPAKLTDENVLSTVLTKFGEINTAAYEVSIGLSIKKREEGAKSYAEMNPITPAMEAAYERDAARLRDIASLELNSQNFKWGDKVFPQSPETLLANTKDPSGKPYEYRVVDGGKDYAYTVTFETVEAYTVAARNVEPEAVNPATKTVTLNSRVHVPTFLFNEEPGQPKLFGLIELSDAEGMIPADFSASVLLGGTVDHAEDAANGKLRMAGEVVFGDASFAVDAEGMKKGLEFFGIINKMPSFFAPLSGIKGKWVRFTEEELRSYGFTGFVDSYIPNEENERKEEFDKRMAQLKKVVEVAERHQLVSITSGPQMEELEGRQLTKYTLALKKDKLLPFYEEVTEALKEYGDEAMFKRDEATVAYLKGEEFSAIYEYINQAVTLTLWMDKGGFPARAEIKVRYVPSEDAVQLKDKQVELVFELDLGDINKPIVIETPPEVMPLDDFLVEVTGKTKEEILLERQEENLEILRSALDSYYEWTGAYPATLNDLTQKRKDVTQKMGSSGSNFMASDFYQDREFAQFIPNDVFTKKPFPYIATTGDYELTYFIELPPYSKDKDARQYWASSGFGYGFGVSSSAPKRVYVPKFVEGNNIANKTYLSLAQQQKTDTDGDTFSDELEKIFGTDPKKADSDQDGVNDAIELTSNNSDPLSNARSKGSDAAIKSNLNNSRAQAELYYDSNRRSYANLCSSVTMVSIGEQINTSGGVFSCAADANEWVAQSPLSGPGASYYCVDHKGNAQQTSASVAGTTNGDMDCD